MTATALPPSPAYLPSVPRYDVRPRPSTGPILLVMQVADDMPIDLLATALKQLPYPLETLSVGDYPESDALQGALLERFGRASVGLQLYLCGDEAFLWPLYALARDAGLQEEEIHLLRQGEERRAVYCVHCASLQCASAADHHDCQHCGVHLEVRQHFSRRLGAYLGVCADADHPYAESRA